MGLFTFGFYNAIENDRLYDADQMSEIFDGIINDGVYATIGNHFIVRQNLVQGELEPNTVLVGSGRAWFNHTWNKLDVDTVYTGPASEKAANRWDAIVLDINRTDRTNRILWITGTPATNPVKPEMEITTEHFQHPFCYIFRRAGINQIEQANIENTIGTNACPFVSGIIDTIDLHDLLLQWTAQWGNWKTDVSTEWTDIKDNVADEWEGIKNNVDSEWTDIKNDVATEWTGIKVDVNEEQQEIINALNQWMEGNQNTFNNWFAGIVTQMTSDVATALQLQINRTSGLVSKTTTFSEDGKNITEAFFDGSRIETEFLDDGNIKEYHYNTDGETLLATKTITFNADGSITENVVYATS